MVAIKSLLEKTFGEGLYGQKSEELKGVVLTNRPFTPVTGVQIPLGTPSKFKELPAKQLEALFLLSTLFPTYFPEIENNMRSPERRSLFRSCARGDGAPAAIRFTKLVSIRTPPIRSWLQLTGKRFIQVTMHQFHRI
ncbi:hypothetical protein [Desulfovibrio sp. DV]|uniref:hypothetical protein n=1 Tax=Desulfovibrio sp. DV TaxID=1844708 RepID=UPI0011150BB1|nr:hypothetical protein [Desulfovibrio sp. DV]